MRAARIPGSSGWLSGINSISLKVLPVVQLAHTRLPSSHPSLSRYGALIPGPDVPCKPANWNTHIALIMSHPSQYSPGVLLPQQPVALSEKEWDSPKL